MEAICQEPENSKHPHSIPQIIQSREGAKSLDPARSGLISLSNSGVGLTNAGVHRTMKLYLLVPLVTTTSFNHIPLVFGITCDSQCGTCCKNYAVVLVSILNSVVQITIVEMNVHQVMVVSIVQRPRIACKWTFRLHKYICTYKGMHTVSPVPHVHTHPGYVYPTTLTRCCN